MSRPGRLNSAASTRSAMAMPTALAKPWPSGPVVVSTPGVSPCSGWPGVFECNWRKRLISSIGRSKPVRCSSAYCSMEPCPLDSRKRSRSGQPGLRGIETQMMVPQHFGDVGHAHGHAGMAGVGLLYRIHRQRAHGVGQLLSCCHRRSRMQGWFRVAGRLRRACSDAIITRPRDAVSSARDASRAAAA